MPQMQLPVRLPCGWHTANPLNRSVKNFAVPCPALISCAGQVRLSFRQVNLADKTVINLYFLPP